MPDAAAAAFSVPFVEAIVELVSAMVVGETVAEGGMAEVSHFGRLYEGE